MKEFVILDREEINKIQKNKPVTIRINGRPIILCSDEYFEYLKLNEIQAAGGGNDTCLLRHYITDYR